MTDAAEILARIDRREREQEDMKLLAERSVEAAQQIKKQLDGLARTTGKDVLEILGYDRDTVMKWANSQKEPLFESDEEKAEFNKFKADKLGSVFRYLDEKGIRQEAKLSKMGAPKRSFVVAWRKDKNIKPIK